MPTFPYPNQRYTSNLGLSLFGMDELLADNMNLIDAAYGAGSSINVNGTLVTSPNLSSTLPVAPAGKTLVTFQFDINGNISAYTSTSGPSGVTSVAMTGDGTIFNSTVSGSPITTSGTLAPALLTQAPFSVLAGPSTAVPNAAPTFRALVAADLPAGTGTVTSFSAGHLAHSLPLAWQLLRLPLLLPLPCPMQQVERCLATQLLGQQPPDTPLRLSLAFPVHLLGQSPLRVPQRLANTRSRHQPMQPRLRSLSPPQATCLLGSLLGTTFCTATLP